MFPDEKWTGPDPARLGLQQLGGGGAIMSDTCNAARKTKRLLSEVIAQTVQDCLGSEQWSAMSKQEQEAATCVHLHDCWQHLRNIFLASMSRAQVRVAFTVPAPYPT